MLDLLSLHIPKTAGSSFLEVLRRLYADRLYLPDDSLDWHEMARRTPSHARGVHGHLMPREFLPDHRDCRIVAWFRDPVQWVIS